MLELFKKVQVIFKPASTQNGKPKALDSIEILKESYYALCSLAEQIYSHADRAPYPHVAQRLRQIAAEKRLSANLLRDKTLSLGERLEEKPPDIKSRRNHWERMVQDLSDQKALENRFLERAALLDEEAPELAELLRDLVVSQRSHKETLLGLITRADPQAEQT